MQLNPTPGGGARFVARVARARVTVDLDADGEIISHTITPRETTPAPIAPDPLRLLTEAQGLLVSARKAVCAGCDQNGGLAAVTVKCNGCGCSGLSLLNGTCKLNKWPTPSAD
jgi:hypothetical protein